MLEIHKKIIEYINQNKSMKQIANILKISEKQLYLNIKEIINYGYNISVDYNYNSDIFYRLNKDIKSNNNSEIKINMSKSDKEFRCIVVSDMHIGNTLSDIYLMNEVYNYCIKNNINIILNCGDLIEGVHSTDSKNINDIFTQIETIINLYPYDNSINNFLVFGNHDIHSLYYDGFDISKQISDSRYDIIPIGYGKGIIDIRKDKLLLEHELSVVPNPNIGFNNKISLVGHGHMMKTKFYDKLYICIPSLSKVTPDKNNDVIPGFVDLNISIENGYFEFLQAKHMIICDKIYQSSETRIRVKELFNSKSK